MQEEIKIILSNDNDNVKKENIREMSFDEFVDVIKHLDEYGIETISIKS